MLERYQDFVPVVLFLAKARLSSDEANSRAILALALGGFGLGGEAGEVMEPIKKYLFHGKDLDKAHIGKEIGDVMWYLALICKALGLDLKTIIEGNMTKLEERYAQMLIAPEPKIIPLMLPDGAN